jgi:hypothetical protein
MIKDKSCSMQLGRHSIIWSVVISFVLLVATFAHADTLTWTNSGATGSWHLADNWDPAQVPADTDDVVIPAGTDPVTYSSGTTNLNSLSCSGSLTISNGVLNLAAPSTVSLPALSVMPAMYR